MSKAIDFFNDLDKREKAISNALKFRNIEGFDCFYCELENCWLTPFACIKRQRREFKLKKQSFEDIELPTNCEICKQADEIQKLTGIKVKKPKRSQEKFKNKRKVIPEFMVCKECGLKLKYKEYFQLDYKGDPTGQICRKCAKLKAAEKQFINSVPSKSALISDINKERSKRGGVNKKVESKKNEKKIRAILKENPDLKNDKESKEFVMDITNISRSTVYHYFKIIFNENKK